MLASWPDCDPMPACVRLCVVIVILLFAAYSAGSSDNVIRLWHARHSTDGSTLLDPAEASAAAADAGITATLPRSAAGRATGLDSLDHGLAESLMELDGPADSDAQHTAIDQSPGGLTAAAVAAVNASSRLRRQGRGPYSVVTGEADEGLFDLTMPGQHLRGHIGPVTSLCLTDSCLYSGSWDYTVRVWRRGSWDCVRWGTRPGSDPLIKVLLAQQQRRHTHHHTCICCLGRALAPWRTGALRCLTVAASSALHGNWFDFAGSQC
jgi:hypothetical protein